jgi:hypothetical protein
MKKKLLNLSLILITVLYGCDKNPDMADEHAHHDHHNDKTQISKPEKKFATDKTLRLHMSEVLNTMKLMHDSGTKVNLPETGAKIELTVQNIFKECKLEPAADAAIHPILADLLKGADLFKKNNEKEGHEIIHNALLQYEDFFDHPGWSHTE